MKVEVYSEKDNEEILRLKLEKRADEVALVAVDRDGNLIAGGNILSIGVEGDIFLFDTVSHKLGLSLDSCGRVNVRKE